MSVTTMTMNEVRPLSIKQSAQVSSKSKFLYKGPAKFFDRTKKHLLDLISKLLDDI